MNTNYKTEETSYSTEFKRAYLTGLLPPALVNNIPSGTGSLGETNPYTIYMATILSMQMMNNWIFIN